LQITKILIFFYLFLADQPQTVAISVEDVDEKPKFVNKPTPFLAVVPEQVPKGYTVYQFQARDENGDGDENVEYRLISTARNLSIILQDILKRKYLLFQAADSFYVDAKNGRVKTAQQRYEPGRSYSVYVQVWFSVYCTKFYVKLTKLIFWIIMVFSQNKNQ